MIIAITGTSGNVGAPVVDAVLNLDVEYIKVLIHNNGKRTRKFLKKHKREIKSGKLRVVRGSLSDVNVCRELVADADYVVNLAAVIPPLAEFKPRAAVECNEHGADALCTAIEQADPQPKLIHFSTIALYSARSEAHPFARPCDPLLVSPYDMYAATKLRGEFRVLESNIKYRAVLRESAVMYDGMFEANIHDGLMFQTPFNTPLEWVSAEDSARLVTAIIKSDAAAKDGVMLAVDGKTPISFWNRVFNICGFPDDRVTGFETYDRLMKIIGAGAKDLFDARDNVTRNFHGVWFADDDLESMFGYRTTTMDAFVAELIKNHKYYSLGKCVSKKLIKKILFDKLKKSENSPAYWAKSGQTERIYAYYGGTDAYEKIGGWDSFPLWCDGKGTDGREIDYAALKARENFPADPMFLTDVPDEEITVDHLREFAKAHGGRLVSENFETGDMYTKLDWETQDGETFSARPYTVLRAGHWHNPTYERNVWEFDRLAKRDKVYAYHWYDTHAADENMKYYLDGDFNAKSEKQ